MMNSESPLPRLAKPPRGVPWSVRRRLLDQRQWAAIGFGIVLVIVGIGVVAGMWLTGEESGRGIGLFIGILSLLIGLTIVRGYGHLWRRRIRLLREGQLAWAEIVACEEYQAIKTSGGWAGESRRPPWIFLPTGNWIPFNTRTRQKLVEWWNEPLPPVPVGPVLWLWWFALGTIAAGCLFILGLLLREAKGPGERLTMAAFFGLFLLMGAGIIRYVLAASAGEAAPRGRRPLFVGRCRFRFRLPDEELIVSEVHVDFSHLLDHAAKDPFDGVVYDPHDPQNAILFSSLSPPLRVSDDGAWNLATSQKRFPVPNRKGTEQFPHVRKTP